MGAVDAPSAERAVDWITAKLLPGGHDGRIMGVGPYIILSSIMLTKILKMILFNVE